MKKLLFSVCALLFATLGQAQPVCNPSMSVAAAPSNNALLGYSFTNTTGFNPSGSVYASFSLDFGDGTSNAWFAGTTNHVYANPGTYSAIMTMVAYDSSTGITLCTDTAVQTIVAAYAPCGSVIAATVNGYTASFTATIPAGTPSVSYLWNFGDGTTSTLQNPTHTYNAMGNFTVTLVTAGGGCTYTNTIAPLGIPASCAGATVSFTHTVSGNTVNFVPSYNGQIQNLVAVAMFDYGDGTSGSQTTHTYAGPGTYYPTLFVQWIDSATSTIVCADSFWQAVTISGNPSGTGISGNVIFDSSLVNASAFMVYQITLDSSGMLSAVDSTVANVLSPNGFAPYSFNNNLYGSFLFKAVPLNQPVGVTGLLPTYHDSSLYWSGANYVSYNGFIPSANNNIWMRVGTTTAGPGFIGGNVSQGANKGTSSGVAGLPILLRNGANQPVRCTYTDANGNYQFSSVPTGIYNIYPEGMNYQTTPSSNFNITATQTSVTGVDFIQDSTTITPVPLSVTTPTSALSWSVYPNPVRDRLMVTLSGAASIEVFTTTGVVIYKSASSGGAQEINVSQFPAGAYFIRVSNAQGARTQQVMICK